jgi:hypothetical protein
MFSTRPLFKSQYPAQVAKKMKNSTPNKIV